MARSSGCLSKFANRFEPEAIRKQLQWPEADIEPLSYMLFDSNRALAVNIVRLTGRSIVSGPSDGHISSKVAHAVETGEAIVIVEADISIQTGRVLVDGEEHRIHPHALYAYILHLARNGAMVLWSRNYEQTITILRAVDIYYAKPQHSYPRTWPSIVDRRPEIDIVCSLPGCSYELGCSLLAMYGSPLEVFLAIAHKDEVAGVGKNSLRKMRDALLGGAAGGRT